MLSTGQGSKRQSLWSPLQDLAFWLASYVMAASMQLGKEATAGGLEPDLPFRALGDGALDPLSLGPTEM